MWGWMDCRVCGGGWVVGCVGVDRGDGKVGRG